MSNATQYFANNKQVFISTQSTYLAVRDMVTMEIKTYVPKTKVAAKIEAFKLEAEALLKSLNYNLDAFNTKMFQDSRIKSIHSRS